MSKKNFGLISGISIIIVITLGLVLVTGQFGSAINMIPGLSTTGEKMSPAESMNLVRGNDPDALILNTTFPASPATVMVYRTLPPDISDADAVAFAGKFGIIGPVNSGSEATSISSPDENSIEIGKKSGCRHYYSKNDNKYEKGVNYHLPTDAEAVQIATAFLTEKDLMPDEIGPGHASHHHIRTFYPNGTETQTDVEVGVGFNHNDINGIPFLDSVIGVGIGDNNEILYFGTNLRNYSPYRELEIKSPEEAFAELKALGTHYGEKTEIQSEVTINKVYLAYKSKACAFTEDYLEPVWVFEGVEVESGFDLGGVLKVTPPRLVRKYIPALKEVPTELVSS